MNCFGEIPQFQFHHFASTLWILPQHFNVEALIFGKMLVDSFTFKRGTWNSPLPQGRGQRVWPQVDLYVSQNVLTAADTWVLAEPDADGADLLFSNGYLCDQGLLSCKRQCLCAAATLPTWKPLQRCLPMGQRLGSTSTTKSMHPNFESDHIHIGTG